MIKICLECAEGGHLDEMLSIINAFEGNEIFFVTTMAPSTQNLGQIARTFYVRNQYDPSNKYEMYLYEIYYLLKLLFSCAIILVKEKPDLIISTGGGSTIPLCYVGKLLGSKIIFIESIARLYKPSVTGRIIYPITNLFLVQWESMLIYYKKAEYWGRVL